MTGLENILKSIENDAKEEADTIIKEAEIKSCNILENARITGTNEMLAILTKAENKALEIVKMGKSASNLKKSKKLLEEKNKIIDELIKGTLLNLPLVDDNEYFDIILKLCRKNIIENASGKIVFSKDDINKMPEQFKIDFNAVCKEKNANLTIGSSDKKVNSGFILVYDDIEDNCTFDALFESCADRVKDKVSNIIFS